MFKFAGGDILLKRLSEVWDVILVHNMWHSARQSEHWQILLPKKLMIKISFSSLLPMQCHCGCTFAVAQLWQYNYRKWGNRKIPLSWTSHIINVTTICENLLSQVVLFDSTRIKLFLRCLLWISLIDLSVVQYLFSHPKDWASQQKLEMPSAD